MTTDVRTLLHESADRPSRPPDLEGAMRSGRARRRRSRGLGALVAVIVVALVTGALVLGGGGDDAQVAIAPRQTGPTIPDGWKTITADPGITVSVPASWKVSSSSVTPIGVPVLSLEDLNPLADDALAACTLGRTPSAAPEEGGSLINMWEFPASSTEVPGTANDVVTVVDRPATFSGALTLGPRACPVAEYQQIAFRDAGRVFLVRAVSVIPSDAENPELLALAAQVLDTLRIEPLEAATTTTAQPFSTTIPPTQPTATTAPAFVPTSDDERAIVQVFERWVDDHTDAELDATVEDPDAVRAPSHEGWNQQTPESLAAYDGRVESIRMLDSDHAEVGYTILHGGQVAFGNRLGSAVKVKGEWRVSTETVCSMLVIGGIRCPVVSSAPR
jgi:hypothetical protein